MRGRGALSPTEKFEINQTSDFVISNNKQYKKRVFRFLGSRFLYFHPWYNVVVCLCSILYGPYPIDIAFFSNSSMSFHCTPFWFQIIWNNIPSFFEFHNSFLQRFPPKTKFFCFCNDNPKNPLVHFLFYQ